MAAGGPSVSMEAEALASAAAVWPLLLLRSWRWSCSSPPIRWKRRRYHYGVRTSLTASNVSPINCLSPFPAMDRNFYNHIGRFCTSSCEAAPSAHIAACETCCTDCCRDNFETCTTFAYSEGLSMCLTSQSRAISPIHVISLAAFVQIPALKGSLSFRARHVPRSPLPPLSQSPLPQ